MNSPPAPRTAPSPTWLSVLRAIGTTIMWFILALLTLWAVAALYVDFRIATLRIPVILIYVLGIIAILFKFKWSRWSVALVLLAFFCFKIKKSRYAGRHGEKHSKIIQH